MVFNAFCQFIGSPLYADAKELLPVAPTPYVQLSCIWDEASLFNLTQLIYDVRKDDGIFRSEMSKTGDDSSQMASAFDQMRKNYWDRREYSAITVAGEAAFAVESLAKLGFTVVEETHESGI